jgi:hypothetical protein
MIDGKFQEAEQLNAAIMRTDAMEQLVASQQMPHDCDEAQKKHRGKQTNEFRLADDAARIQIAQFRQRRNWGKRDTPEQKN